MRAVSPNSNGTNGLTLMTSVYDKAWIMMSKLFIQQSYCQQVRQCKYNEKLRRVRETVLFAISNKYYIL
jgi:hypothetical protein